MNHLAQPTIDLFAPAGSVPELDDLVRAVLTHAVFVPKDRKGTSQLAAYKAFLRLYAVAEVRLDGGSTSHSALIPGMDSFPAGSTAETVWRKYGYTFQSEQDYWKSLMDEMGVRYALAPADRLLEYMPIEYWAVVRALVSEDPRLFRDRAQKAVEMYSERRIKKSKRRPTQGVPPLQNSINLLCKNAGRLIVPLIDSNAFELPIGHPAALRLAAWRQEYNRRPRFTCKSKAEDTTTVAYGPVPMHKARHLFNVSLADARKRLRMSETDTDLLQALTRLPDAGLTGIFRPVRAMAMLVAMVVLGSRIESLTEVTRGDVEVLRNNASGRGPAVRITPFKTDGGSTPRHKPIPEDAVAILVLLMRVVDRLRAAQGLAPLTDSDPLFTSYATGTSKWTALCVGKWFGGNPGQRKAVISVVPDQPYAGYTPHSYRKLSRSMISSVPAQRWADEHELAYDQLDVIGEILLDHDLKDLISLYKGYTEKQAAERLAALGSEICWLLLSTPLGARTVPDGDAYRHALIQREAVGAERLALRAELIRMCEEAEKSNRELSPTGMMARLVKLDDLSDRQMEAEKRVLRIENGDVRISIPDDVDELPRIDLRAIQAEVFGGASNVLHFARHRVRNWLTPAEVARVFGQGESTVRGWMTKGLPRGKSLWSDGAIHEFSSRRRVVLADLISESALNSPEKRAVLAEIMATDPPEGWTTFEPFIGEARSEMPAAA